MSGVAIATALMPPLCTVGYGIASWNWHYAFGALYLFLINSILIALATFLTVKYLHYPVVEEQSTNGKRRAWSIALVVAVLVVPSVMSAISTKPLSAAMTVKAAYSPAEALLSRLIRKP